MHGVGGKEVADAQSKALDSALQYRKSIDVS